MNLIGHDTSGEPQQNQEGNMPVHVLQLIRARELIKDEKTVTQHGQEGSAAAVTAALRPEPRFRSSTISGQIRPLRFDPCKGFRHLGGGHGLLHRRQRCAHRLDSF